MRLTIIIIFLASLACQKRDVALLDLENTPAKLELFAPNQVSTHLYERDLAISPNGDEIIFTVSNYKQNVRGLFSLSKKNGFWEDKKLLPFCGIYQDIEPFITPDGQKLFFASNRPLDSTTSRKDYNIWVSPKSNVGWGNPHPLNGRINLPGDEFYPSVSQNGNLYFTATRKDGMGKEDIFISRYEDGNYTDPIPLGSGVNSQVYEFNAYISPNESLLIFSSYGRSEELGGGDLYFSRKNTEGQWTKAQNLGPDINSKKLDYCPFVDFRNSNFYFTSDRMSEKTAVFSSYEDLENSALQPLNGMGNIYRIAMSNTALKE